MLDALRRELQKVADPEKVAVYKRFFKTGEGEYGYGDVFIGVTVVQSRIVAKKFVNLPLADVEKLLSSKIHEERLIAVFLLVYKFNKTNGNPPPPRLRRARKEIYDFYLANTKYVNNWDLVDSSAHHIVGAYLWGKKDDTLVKLAKSKNLWERRIAIIATHYFIRKERFDETLAIAEMLLHDPHDLMHKAVGWMLREVGNRDRKREEEFLKKHYRQMPRTMLRYAIEKFPSDLRSKYLSKVLSG